MNCWKHLQHRWKAFGGNRRQKIPNNEKILLKNVLSLDAHIFYVEMRISFIFFFESHHLQIPLRDQKLMYVGFKSIEWSTLLNILWNLTKSKFREKIGHLDIWTCFSRIKGSKWLKIHQKFILPRLKSKKTCSIKIYRHKIFRCDEELRNLKNI